MNLIYDIVKSVAAYYLILRVFIELVPNEKYRRYVKLFGSFLILTVMMQQTTNSLHNAKIEAPKFGIEDANFDLTKTEKSTKLGVLSTYENEIKTQLNKQEYFIEYAIKSLKIGFCEDVDSVDYGKICDVDVIISKNVDKTANISVNKIIVRQMMDSDLKCDIQKQIADSLSLSVEVVSVTCE